MGEFRVALKRLEVPVHAVEKAGLLTGDCLLSSQAHIGDPKNSAYAILTYFTPARHARYSR